MEGLRPMLKIKNRQRELLLIVISLSGAVTSGLFVAGVGNAAWWFLGALVALVLIGMLLTRDQVRGIGADSSTEGSLRRNWRNTALLLSICCTVSLSWLALHREPLPALDLGTSGLVMVLFSLTSIGLVLFFLRLPLLSFPGLFLGVTFLFTSSSLIVYQFEGLDAFRGWMLVDIDSVVRAMPLVMLAFSSFSIGALLFGAKSSNRYRAINGYVVHTYSSTLWKVGFILLCISIVVIVFYSFRGLGLGAIFEGGYHKWNDSRQEMPTILYLSLDRLLPWSVLILVAASRNQRAYRQALLLAIPALGIMLLMGSRAELLGTTVLMASGSCLLGFSMDWKRSLVVLALVAFLVPTVLNLRGTPVRDWSLDLLTKAMTNQVGGIHASGRSSPVATGLAEMGASYQTLMMTIMLVPDIEPHRYGLDYLRSLPVAIPFASRIFPASGINLLEDVPTSWISIRLDPSGRHQLGYLQIAEAYLQFGTFGVVGLYVVLGWVFPRLWWSLRGEDLDSQKLALVLIVMLGVLNWIRNDATGLIRAFAWGWILVYGIPAIIDALQRLGKRAGASKGWQ